MKKIATMIILLLALAGTLYSAWTLSGKTAAMREENEIRLREAQTELEEQKTALAAIDPTTDEGMARQIEAQKQAIAEAREKAEKLQAENETLRRENEELRDQISGLETDEDNAYYLKVYESLHRGMEMVEDCIDGE